MKRVTRADALVMIGFAYEVVHTLAVLILLKTPVW